MKVGITLRLVLNLDVHVIVYVKMGERGGGVNNTTTSSVYVSVHGSLD